MKNLKLKKLSTKITKTKIELNMTAHNKII